MRSLERCFAQKYMRITTVSYRDFGRKSKCKIFRKRPVSMGTLRVFDLFDLEDGNARRIERVSGIEKYFVIAC